MHLINAETRQLKAFFDADIPSYSILSHRWLTKGEVDHQTFKTSGQGANLQGFAKIAAACDLSLRRGIKYTWVDTCCIDKTDSAELTESINSMFEWYEKAEVCFAFLDDVEPNPWGPSRNPIEESKWMKRGWTLQELLAPKRVEFYAADWTMIGTRDALAPSLCSASSISERYLRDGPPQDSRQDLIRRASMGERMSWAAQRETTRKEDEAYCLLGLFGVNMPLIYGEGDKAFIRLQEEILRHSFDPTLLAWGELKADDPLLPLEAPDPSMLVSALNYCGVQHPWSRTWRDWRGSELGFVAPSVSILAPKARHFLHCDNLVPSQSCSELSWALTPQGLQINIPVSRWFEFEQHPYLVTPCFPRKHPALLLAVPIIAMDDGSFGRGSGAAILVPAHKWYQWPRTNLVLTTRSGTVPVDERQRSSSLCCDVWIRSWPTGFTIRGLPDVDFMSGDDNGTESGILLGAKQVWQVSGTAMLRASLKFSIHPPGDYGLAVHVSRGPYHARPVPAYLPKYALWFRATSRRNYSAASITALDGEPPPVESNFYLGEIHRSGEDILKTTNGDLVSVELTKKDIAGRPLLVIDIRQGPSRLGHLWRTGRISSSQTSNSQQAGVTTDRLMARMILAAMLWTAIWLYDIFRLMYLIPLIPWYRLRRNNLFLYVLSYASTLLEVFRMSGLRPSSAISVCLYFLAGYNFWQVFKADDFLRGSLLIWEGVVVDWIPRIGVGMGAASFVYSLLPLFSILLPCTTSFLRRYRLAISAVGAGSLSNWAPEVCKSPITIILATVFVFMTSGAMHRSPRFMFHGDHA